MAQLLSIAMFHERLSASRKLADQVSFVLVARAVSCVVKRLFMLSLDLVDPCIDASCGNVAENNGRTCLCVDGGGYA